MNIWIMRHGEAGFFATSDSERTLTKQGEEAAFKQGEWLAKRLLDQSVNLDKILVSPYVRAQQTFEQLTKGLQAGGSVQSFAKLSETWEGIVPSGNPENVINYLRFLREEGAQNVLVISHLPLVFDLAQCLTNHQESVSFYPAVIAEIEWFAEKGRLVTVGNP